MSAGLRLRRMRLGDEAAVRCAQREFAAEDFEFTFGLDATTDWRDHLTEVARYEAGDVPEGKVASTFLVAELDGEIIGRCSIRHELNDWLARFGGHIGYGVRPKARGHGYGSEILRQSIMTARGLGLDELLVICDEDNVASRRVVERVGGEIGPVIDSPSGTRVVHYWLR